MESNFAKLIHDEIMNNIPNEGDNLPEFPVDSPPHAIVKIYIGLYPFAFIFREMHLQPNFIKVARENNNELRFQAGEDDSASWLLLLYMMYNDNLPKLLEFANKNVPDPNDESAPIIQPAEVDIFDLEGGTFGRDGLDIQALPTNTWLMCQRYNSKAFQIALLQAYSAWLDKDCESIDPNCPRPSCAAVIAPRIFSITEPGALLRDVIARGLIKALKGNAKLEKEAVDALKDAPGGRECMQKAKGWYQLTRGTGKISQGLALEAL